MARFSILLQAQLFYTFMLTAIHGVSSSQQIITSPQEACTSQDAPNQHAQQHPTFVSGNLNGTTLIVPISLKTARQVIPKEYGINEKAYKAILPSFPDGMYPMMAQIVHDHDVQLPVYNASLADFSRASLEFPFVDIFNDGHSSFRWASTFMISATNPLAIAGAEGYGVSVHPSTFDPACDAYAALPHGGSYARAQSGRRFMSVQAKPSWSHVPYGLDFLRNVTNQPVFANARLCDYFLRFFNTTLSSSATPVVADVSVGLEPFAQPRSWHGVHGWRMATAFLEPVMPEECRPMG
ncbi:hypothetical protein F4804DRAFT_337796 [Jackrogersella minutella]|nr:hypothetical protein F4804DRAFT_337796 [Jackrogersella minutella]